MTRKTTKKQYLSAQSYFLYISIAILTNQQKSYGTDHDTQERNYCKIA